MRATLLLTGLVLAITAGNTTARAEILLGLPTSLSGAGAWGGTEHERGAKMAVDDLNAAGGVLGEKVLAVMVDDYCDSAQAVAVANKLVAEGVDFVLGHVCSDASIPASRVYADAGIPVMTELATNPLLTEQGLTNVFRICGRDDAQGAMAGSYLATRWKGRNIAILHDGSVYGKGLAEHAKMALNSEGIAEVLFGQIDPDAVDHSDVLDQVGAAGTDALYFSGYSKRGALLIRQIRERGDDLQFVTGDSGLSEPYSVIAGEARDGMIFTSFADARSLPSAAGVLAALSADGSQPDTRSLFAYAAVQAWAQAVERAGSPDGAAVSQALHGGQFDTVLGQVGFDDKGDVTGFTPFGWYTWQGESVVPANLTD